MLGVIKFACLFITYIANTAEVQVLRKMVGQNQKSVAMNLCSIEPIADSNVEIGRSIVKLRVQSGDVKEFYFNNVFNGVDCSKLECMISLLNAFLSGENACVIAHGETGICFIMLYAYLFFVQHI